MKFLRRFIELASGVGLAQVVSLLFMPFISRTYSPADLGVFAIYLAISGIVGGVSCLRLDVAVVLAKDDDEAIRLVWLAMGLALMTGFLTLCGMFAIRHIFSFEWTDLFCVLTGLSIFLIGASQGLLYWHNRQRCYRLIAIKNVGERLSTLGLSLGLGLIGLKASGLLIGQAVGFCLGLIYLLSTSKIGRIRYSPSAWRHTLSSYSDFPRKNVFGSLFNTFAIFGAPLLFAGYFVKTEVGYLSLATRVFDLPITIVGNTFHVVYYQHIGQKSLAEKKVLFSRSLKLLTGLFVLPLAVAAIWGVPIFTLVFGKNWAISGQIALFLAPLTLCRLAFLSQAPLLLVGRRLTRDMWISGFQFASQAAGFFVGYYFYGSFQACAGFMCLFGAVMYLIGLTAIYETLIPVNK